jgi:hypothetical protein
MLWTALQSASDYYHCPVFWKQKCFGLLLAKNRGIKYKKQRKPVTTVLDQKCLLKLLLSKISIKWPHDYGGMIYFVKALEENWDSICEDDKQELALLKF